MKYVGIDLGTTNSAICTFDGENIKLYKSPEQNDVTPSAIYFDRRGNKHVGVKAYNYAALDPENAAIKFKRVIGTSTPITLTATQTTMSPEQCSAEILKVLFSYLPEEIRNSSDTGTVITVPAAFNQMQKDATMSAAEMAGLGNVALMQEPVAAVMSVMRHRKSDGIFIIYDLGGGTLDVAIAESISGRVSLLAHGGVAMCGGGDFDRKIVDNIVKPWLVQNFKMPNDFTSLPQFKKISRIAAWASEKAKIELSQKEQTKITATESELGVKDLEGRELYFDIEFNRHDLESLISSVIDDSIEAVRETMKKANLESQDIERIVFVGGPTHYKPLRDRVAQELGIAGSTDVNPMTAVAEGAAIFAESLNWESKTHERKNSRGTISSDGKLELSFSFISRTPDVKAKIAAKISGSVHKGSEFQIDSLDTGWSSGRVVLKDGAVVDVGLSKPGDNTFKIFVFDGAGGAITLKENKIVITRTAATIDAIPASSSIGIAVLDKLGGQSVLSYLVKEGEPLPKKGRLNFKAGESLRAQSANALRFKIYEGEIHDRVEDNQFVGTFSIEGTDFEDGVIAAGAELSCEFEVLDSGQILLKVSVPSIQSTFTSRNLYSRKAGEIDYSQAAKQIEGEVKTLQERVEKVSEKISDPNLEKVSQKLEQASKIDEKESDPEIAKKAMDNVHDAKKLFADIRAQNLKIIRQIDLERCTDCFEKLREFARPTEITAFDTQAKTAQRVISNTTPEFESHLGQLWGKCFEILFRQDWFIVDRFNTLAKKPHIFPDKNQHRELVALGRSAIDADDMAKLREVLGAMEGYRIDSGSERDFMATTNIVRA